MAKLTWRAVSPAFGFREPVPQLQSNDGRHAGPQAVACSHKTAHVSVRDPNKIFVLQLWAAMNAVRDLSKISVLQLWGNDECSAGP